MIRRRRRTKLFLLSLSPAVLRLGWLWEEQKQMKLHFAVFLSVSHVNFYCNILLIHSRLVASPSSSSAWAAFGSLTLTCHVEVARLFNYLTAKRSRLLNINGGYYIYIIGVTIAGHIYDGREELQFDFSAAGSHRHSPHQHTHTRTYTCIRSIFTQSTHSTAAAAHNALAVSLRQPHETPKE